MSWWSRKLQLVVRSSTEVEYRSLTATTSEVLWIQSLLKELQVNSKTPVVYFDNLSTVALSHNSVLPLWTKHMELGLFFVRERVIDKTLAVYHIPGPEKVADLLTKPLSQSRFKALRRKVLITNMILSQNHLPPLLIRA